MMKNLSYIMRFVWRADKAGVIIQFLSTFWNVFFVTVTISITKLFIDGALNEKPLWYMLSLAVGYFAVTTISLFLMLCVSPRINSRIAMRTEKVITEALLTKAVAIDAVQYDDPVFFDMLSKAMANADTRATAVLSQLLGLLSGALNFAVSFGLMAIMSPALIVVSVVSIVLTYIINLRFAKRQFAMNDELAPMLRRSDYFKNILFQRTTVYDIKQHNDLGGLLLARFEDALETKHTMKTKMDMERLYHSMRVQVLTGVATTLFPYLYMGYGVYAGMVSIANLTVLIGAFNNANTSLSALSNGISTLKESGLYVGHLKTILEYAPQIESDSGTALLEPLERIEFRNVSFRYPNSDDYALREVSFAINKGEKIAVVGINGAGKTTLVKLLLRFYDPDDGCILINGIDIRDYNISSLRRKITSIFQEFQSYAIPIAEIVSCASGAAVDREKVSMVLKRVSLLDKVESVNTGIDTEYSRQFNESGVVFSGGQLQKLMIARMLYKDSDVLIMDEPSSALDPESEYEINRDITNAAMGKTVIIISHRLSTTKDADKILLLDGGAVAESGSHEDLMMLDGKYKRLFSIQAETYISEINAPPTAYA